MTNVPEGTTLPCIVCKEPLPPAFEGLHEANQPHGGTTFHARGQYGSTVFDPMDSQELEINVCDPCLVKAADDLTVIHNTPVRTSFRARFWDSDLQ